MVFGCIRLREIDNGIMRLTLARAEKRNALNLQMCDELLQAANQVSSNDEIRVLIVDAEGPVFCAGADLAERKGKGAGWVRERRRRAFAAYNALADCPQALIAIVNGPLVGSGGEIAMSCDMIYGSQRATFRFPEATWGTVGATQRLARRIGKARAKELLFTGDTMDAQEAERVGLLNRTMDADTIEQEVLDIAKRIANTPPLALRLTKQCVDLGLETDLARGIAIEKLAIDRALSDSEWQAGVTRFNQDKK